MPTPRSAPPLRSAWLRSLLLVIALGLALPLGEARGTTTAEYCVDAEEQAFLALINGYRGQNGLGALTSTQTLGAAADHHSIDMATNDYFSHTMLDGTDVAQNLQNHGYPDGTYGENIAAGMETADVAFTTWQNSPGHNANMLRSSYQAIGIGRAYDAASGYGWYWTTVFGGAVDGAATPCGSAPPSPSPSPAPSPEPSPSPVPTPGENAAASSPLNLRSGPGDGYSILGTVPAGARVAVTGPIQDGYYPLTYAGQSGWAAAEFLALDAAPPVPTPTPTPTPVPDPTAGTATVTTDLNLRAGPSTADAVLLTMPAGSTVTLSGQTSNGFAAVTYNGTAGWAFAAYLGGPSPAPAPDPAPTPPPGGTTGTATATSDLNLRSGPGVGFPVLAVMPPGASVATTGGAENGFLAVRYNGLDGWAAAEFLAVGGAPPTPPVPTPTPPSPDPFGTGTATTTTDLNLRAGPSTADAVLLVIPTGTIVTRTGESANGFVGVTVNGVAGWAFGGYLA